jgi:replicative DNA helicase
VGLKGAKRGELWTHAAFTGGLKSTLALNWHYNQAVYYQHSGVLFSLEMPYRQVRRILYAMHSAHDKFSDVRQSMGLGPSLDYEHIRDGELSPEGKVFLRDHVVPDFNDPANTYGHIHIEVADPDKSDFTVTDLNTRLALLYQKDPAIQMVTLDHAGLMQSRNKYRSTTEKLNEVLRDLKRLSMSFNRGAGLAVVALFQISREGFKSAEKNGGRYNLTHLSYANEAERSSDVVTASWVDEELRESNRVKFQCLKSRDHKPFDEFYSGVLWAGRRIVTIPDMTPQQAGTLGDNIDDLDL